MTSNEVKNKEIIVGIVTDIDLLHYVTRLVSCHHVSGR